MKEPGGNQCIATQRYNAQWEKTMKRLLLIGAAAFVFTVLPILSASAAPSGTILAGITSDSDAILVKGGHGVGRGHGHRAFGWSQGRKVGWRGRGCPPGLWKQGRC